MGRPIEATDDMVVEAGQTLSAAGKRVTGYSLRKYIGTGDSSRLEAVWLAHLAASAPATAAPAPVTLLPQALEAQREAASTRVAEVLTELFTKAWACADELAQGTVAAEQAAAREKVADADQRLADADDCIKQADLEVQREAERADKAEALLEKAREDVAKAANQYTALEATGIAKADIAKADIAEMNDKLSASQAALGVARTKTSAAEATAAAVQTEAGRTRAELDAARADLSKAADRQGALETAGRAAADQAAATIAQLTARLAASEAGLALASQELTSVRDDAIRSRSELETFRDQEFGSLQALVADLQRRLDQQGTVPEAA